MRRLPVAETTDIVASSLEGGQFVVFLDSLEVPPSQAEFFAQVVDRAQTVAAMDDANRRVRIERLLWRFGERIELRPLAPGGQRGGRARAAGRRGRAVSGIPARGIGSARHVARESGGVPAAIVGMVQAAEQQGEIAPAEARSWTHDAGATVRRHDPGGGARRRRVRRAALSSAAGMGATDIYVLSGIATALLAAHPRSSCGGCARAEATTSSGGDDDGPTHRNPVGCPGRPRRCTRRSGLLLCYEYHPPGYDRG
ncbi:MAG: hypothetical protein U5L11_01045 [Arhodomonas sp.]|nr:hypothetical protein [Arhodomonas sp.]